jgi:hypothetical protein
MKRKSIKDLDMLENFMWLFGTVVGGIVLGHCFFYYPDYYLSNPLEIYKFGKEDWKVSEQYCNLLFFISFSLKRNRNFSFLWLVIDFVIVGALAG